MRQVGLGALLALVAGCGRGGDVPTTVTVYEVKGKVLLAGEKPLATGRVAFVRTEAPFITSSAPVGPDGNFSLTTGESGEGAPAGEYKVRVETDGPPPVVGVGRGGSKGLPFPQKYLDEDSSGLTVTVKAEPNRLQPFVLK